MSNYLKPEASDLQSFSFLIKHDLITNLPDKIIEGHGPIIELQLRIRIPANQKRKESASGYGIAIAIRKLDKFGQFSIVKFGVITKSNLIQLLKQTPFQKLNNVEKYQVKAFLRIAYSNQKMD